MAVAASVTIAVVLGGQQALLLTDEPLQTVTAPERWFSCRVQGDTSKFRSANVPVAAASSCIQSRKQVDLKAEAAATRAFYNELAEERALSLGSVHQTTSSDVSISPFIARLAEPKADQ